MTILTICWMLTGPVCIGTGEEMPDHYTCVLVKRLWIERWIADGTEEPDSIKCRRVK